MDLTFRWNGTFADLDYDGLDLLMSDELSSSIISSLFSDARAPEDVELPGDQDERRGWWADALNPDEDATGSLLWLLERSKSSPSVLRDAELFGKQALQWLADDGVVKEVNVTAERQDALLVLLVELVRLDDTDGKYRFEIPLEAN